MKKPFLTLTLALILTLTAACDTGEKPHEPLFKLDKGEVIQVEVDGYLSS